MNFLSDIRPGPEVLPSGDYAMWFPSDREPLFAPSETRKNLRRMYAAVRGIETYAYGEFLGKIANVKWVAAPGRDVPRVALPRDLAVHPIVVLDDQVFALSACREKGLRLHFHQTATPEDRNRVLASFSAFAEAMGRVWRLAGFPVDESSDESPEKWWAFCEEFVVEMETTQGKPIDAVGQLLTGSNPL